MDAIFVDDKPARITVYDFRRFHLQSFPSLADAEYDDLIASAIETVYTMFPGVAKMWDMHRNRQAWFDKTTLCYRLLVAWFIADQYPQVSSVASVNGVLKRKKVDGVDVTFNIEMFKDRDPLVWLRSNDFGRKALMMMQTAPRRALLRLERIV